MIETSSQESYGDTRAFVITSYSIHYTKLYEEKGENTAERAPMLRKASPLRILRHWSARSARVSPLCRTAAASPKRARTRPSSWGVRAISGTRYTACLPVSRACSIALRYTSVFPDPVIP